MPFDIIVGRNDADKELFGKKGLAYIGKTFVTMGNYTSLSNPIYLDVARSHVVLIAGKRGGGKSYTIGALAESLSSLEESSSNNVSSIIFDTMGIFWTMKFKNRKDKDLLEDWKLEAKNVSTTVYAPFGHFHSLKERGIPVDKEFSVRISELRPEDWISLFNLNFTDPEAILLMNIFKDLRDFSFEGIRNAIELSSDFSQDVRNALKSFFDSAESWGIFSKEGIDISNLSEAGKSIIIDLSMYSSTANFNVRALIISLVSKKLFDTRMNARRDEEISSIQHGLSSSFFNPSREKPLVWIFIDEAHEFLPKNSKTPATDALVQILREGRQPGISLVLATQQPGKIHTDAITQSDVVISHRVTSEQDLVALNQIMQSYLYSGIKQKMDELPRLKGSAIILDDNSERIYPMRVRPRFTWHGGEAPSSVKIEEDE